MPNKTFILLFLIFHALKALELNLNPSKHISFKYKHVMSEIYTDKLRVKREKKYL